MRGLYLFLYFFIAPLFGQGQTLPDLQNNPATLLSARAKTATVLIFLSPECPLCQSYSLTLRNLVRGYQSNGVVFIGIVPGKEFSKEQIIAFQHRYQLKEIKFITDPDLNAVKQFGATITPEVVVIDPKGQMVYRGRIDNWAYELGRKRTKITEHDLDRVLNKLCQNIPFKPYTTKAIGCFIQ